jgi:hypothetical protein
MVLPAEQRSNLTVRAMISAENTRPRTVGDQVMLRGPRPFTIEYVRGSARIRTNFLDSLALDDSIVQDGVAIGYIEMNGRIPSDVGRGSGWVTIRARVRMPE